MNRIFLIALAVFLIVTPAAAGETVTTAGGAATTAGGAATTAGGAGAPAPAAPAATPAPAAQATDTAAPSFKQRAAAGHWSPAHACTIETTTANYKAIMKAMAEAAAERDRSIHSQDCDKAVAAEEQVLIQDRRQSMARLNGFCHDVQDKKDSHAYHGAALRWFRETADGGDPAAKKMLTCPEIAALPTRHRPARHTAAVPCLPEYAAQGRCSLPPGKAAQPQP